MKYLFVLAIVCFSVAGFGQTTGVTAAKFNSIKHTFGKIKQNVPATYIFKFTNTSSKPLVIESAVAQCGCTTPEYPKGAIAKGKSGTIKVTYNAATMGVFTKTVTVKFAGVKDPVILTIDGEVIAK